MQNPKLIKKFIELNPSILQNQQVVDIIATIQKKKSMNTYLEIRLLPYLLPVKLSLATIKKDVMNFNLSQIPERNPKPRASWYYNGNG